MSTHSRITDDEMKYYQFKARQQFLIRKEDHDWNEFCKKTKCTCCSCQPSNIQKSLEDKGIQATAKASSVIRPNTLNKSICGTAFPDSLNEIREKLENMNLTLSQLKRVIPYEKKSQQNPDISNEEKLKESDSAILLLTEQRQRIIRASLLNSIHRLQSFVQQRSSKPLSSQVAKKNCSFFLPHDLQKQRQVARKAYLASLSNKPKVETKRRILTVHGNKKEQLEKNNVKPKVLSKPRLNRFSAVKIKEKPSLPDEVITMIQAQSKNEDESIETVVDGIVNDLLREEVLALNRIKHKKTEILNDKDDTSKISKFTSTHHKKKEIHLSKPSLEISTKIKQIPFFNLNYKKEEKSKLLENTLLNDQTKEDKKRQILDEPGEQNSCSLVNQSRNKQSNLLSRKNYKTIFVDHKLKEEVSTQRKLYFKYLDKTSRARSYNFDPVTLSNMVSETLLNDCIADICKELKDVPSSFIADLYNQEFAQTL